MSTWLIYTDGLRAHLDAARRRQTQRASHPPRDADSQPAPAPASLRTERDQLRQRLRLRLGAEIDEPDPAELTARVAALESQARQLLAERDARAREADHAQHRAAELEDDLTAARENLRRVIKEHNRPSQ